MMGNEGNKNMVATKTQVGEDMVDIAIIGAGITGSFLAHDLSMYEGSVMVLEKDADVANEATMANSAIIHSGHDPKDHTLKEQLNVRGNAMYETICKNLGVEFQRTSAYVVATSEEEERTLDGLYAQAKRRKVPVTYVSVEEAKKEEKNLSDMVTKVIELPTTGVINPWEVAIALMEEAVMNGADLQLECEVQGIVKKENNKETYFEIKTSKGIFEAKIIINAAGVYADKIYSMVSDKQTRVSIKARKGEYYVLDRLKDPLVKRVIYPVPSEKGKGVLVVPTVHGNCLLGPNSDFIEDKEGNNSTKTALDYVREELKKTIKNVPMDKVIRVFAGLRPTGDTHDFVIEEAADIKNFINVACIESPGLVSAPAVSEYVMETILKTKKEWKQKAEIKRRKPYINLKHMTVEEREKLVAKDPSFAKIVCRCEQISEGEILDAIRRPVGGVTVKGVKKRCRPGMGRCQGGFCQPLIVDILAKELGISPLDVRLDSKKSTMLVDTTKEEE
jgi:glycerol-3-phosphate dehydrogenase